MVIRRVPGSRMLTIGPFDTSGGMIALSRLPSASRASTMGDDSSTLDPDARRFGE